MVIVDDHEVVRDSFRGHFGGRPGFEVVADLANADDVDLVCRRLRPDLVLLDVCTEANASGLAAARRLREWSATLKLVVMSGFDEITYAARARQAGANAFVSKTRGLEDFAAVIDEVLAGEDVFDEPDPATLPDCIGVLTPRERQILRLLCAHSSRKDIAHELRCSEMTVKRHVSNMLTKTVFTDSVELAFHVISNGWVNPRV